MSSQLDILQTILRKDNKLAMLMREHMNVMRKENYSSHFGTWGKGKGNWVLLTFILTCVLKKMFGCVFSLSVQNLYYTHCMYIIQLAPQYYTGGTTLFLIHPLLNATTPPPHLSVPHGFTSFIFFYSTYLNQRKQKQFIHLSHPPHL